MDEESIIKQLRVLCADIDLVTFFEEVYSVSKEDIIMFKYLNFFICEIPHNLDYNKIEFSDFRQNITPEQMAELIYRIHFKKILMKDAKVEFRKYFQKKEVLT